MTDERRAQVADFWGVEAMRHRLGWPDEALARFMGTCFPAGGEGRRALEIGCGGGRNLRLLASAGFETVGVDISPDAADSAREAMAAARIPARIVTGDFADSLDRAQPFDVIVWDSPFLDTMEGMAARFARAAGLLKPGGMMWTRFRHPDSWFSSLGEQAEDGAVVLDARAGPYAGALYLFVDGDAGRAVLRNAGLDILNRERVELWKNDEAERHVWTVFWARRPEEGITR